MHANPTSHHHHRRQTPEQLLDAVKADFDLLVLSQELLMDSLQRLQAAAAAQGDLITAAQTRINTLEAAVEAGGGGADPTKFVAAADVDAVSATLEANNEALAALTASPATPG